jgi:DNA-binding transcriptional ArsR family regulator
MLTDSTSNKDQVFRALADPTRRAILDMLREERRSVSELTGAFDISQPAVSQHLKLLRDANLVSEEKVGRRRFYELNAEPLVEAQAWLELHVDFWTSRFEQLGAHLRAKHGAKTEI